MIGTTVSVNNSDCSSLEEDVPNSQTKQNLLRPHNRVRSNHNFYNDDFSLLYWKYHQAHSESKRSQDTAMLN